MVAAFLFTNYASHNIFIADSPKPNPFYLSNLQNQFKKNLNTVYLAFSSSKKNNKKNIANNQSSATSFVFNPSTVPTSTSAPTKSEASSMIGKIDVSKIEENLFKSLSTGVSAYEAGDHEVILKINKGVTLKTLKTKKFALPDGRIVEAIDFSENK